MSFSEAAYPNLELIEHIFKEALNKDETFIERAGIKKKENKWAHPSFDVVVFPQIWGSTATAFDVTDDGEPTIGGCAMTKAYTTVIHETMTDLYAVFIGNRPCYLVTNPAQAFYDDLRRRSMASKKEAYQRY